MIISSSASSILTSTFTCRIYQAMGFPMDIFTVLFAIPRMSGWLAQWKEMLLDPNRKLPDPGESTRVIRKGTSRPDHSKRDMPVFGELDSVYHDQKNGVSRSRSKRREKSRQTGTRLNLDL